MKHIPLDLPSEAIMSWEEENYPKTEYTCFILQGKCEIETLQEAYREAQESYLSFSSYLREEKRGLKYYPFWEIQKHRNKLHYEDVRNEKVDINGVEKWLEQRFHSDMFRHINLKKEFPIAPYLFQFDEELYGFALLFHHVATDGGRMYLFLKDIFSIYHQKITGQKPVWHSVSAIHAMKEGGTAVTSASIGQYLKWAVRQEIKYPRRRLAGIQTEERPIGPGRYILRHVFDDQTYIKALLDRSRRNGGSLSDLLLTSVLQSIEYWNRERQGTTDIMWGGLAVNQRVRQPDKKELGNPMSAAIFPTNEKERKSAEDFLNLMINRRKEFMTRGYDIAIFRIMERLASYTRYLSMQRRQKLLNKMMTMPLTFFITNLGVVWPEFKDGRLTGDTAIKEAGKLRITDIHTNISAARPTGCVLIVRSFQRKLYMVFVMDHWKFTEAEAQAFSDLYFKTLNKWID